MKGRPRIPHRFIDDVEYKLCSSCKEWHTLDNFHKDKTKKDNLDNWCKECYKQHTQSKKVKRIKYT